MNPISQELFPVTLEHIEIARKSLSPFLPPSPLLFNPWLSEIYKCEIYLKLENMQPIGSFKIRGATYKILQLTTEEKKRGVIAASAGNHAQGVAWGSRKLGVDALIVMPKNAPLLKVKNTQSLGAKVLLEGNTYDEAFRHATEIAKSTGRVYIHAFADQNVIAGQGVTGLEILEQLPTVNYVLASIGGGGLLAGTSVAIKSINNDVKLIGCQASGAPSMIESFKQKKSITLKEVNTFADGIAVAGANEGMRKLLEQYIEPQILSADDEAIAAAILSLLEKGKIVAEGAGALPLAALQSIQNEIVGKKVVLIIGGGNIDVNLLSRIVDRGLIREGRRIRINILISDKTGSLAQITQLIASEGANIIQAIHDRSEASTRIDQTEVLLTLETKGHAHSEKIVETLKKNVIRLQIAH